MRYTTYNPMFDTHCHLNFKRFKKNLEEVICRAKDSGVVNIVMPGTDIITSKKAIEIAEKYKGVCAAVGIHPHHAYDVVQRVACNAKREEVAQGSGATTIKESIGEIEKLLQHPKVVAIGEVGMDRHIYEETKYSEYAIDKEFLNTQKIVLTQQIHLAIKYKKSLILHNREAKADILPILETNWNPHLAKHAVFHCCEADSELLDYAKKLDMFIGVDGDVTYDKKKQDFIKEVPLEMLVVETDSPYILPEPLLSQRKYPNEPANVRYVVKMVAQIKNIAFDEAIKITTENGKTLFQL